MTSELTSRAIAAEIERLALVGRMNGSDDESARREAIGHVERSMRLLTSTARLKRANAKARR